jgi:DNA repair protein RadC
MEENSGHRQRLKERFLKEGLKSFRDEEVLELLLFYVQPRKDTKKQAKELVARFETLEGVLIAEPELLTQIKGVGSESALFLKLMGELGRRLYSGTRRKKKKISSIEDALEHLKPLFMLKKREEVHILCLDSDKKLLATRLISEGIANQAEINVRRAVEESLRFGSVSVILAHNHPGGSAEPSFEDEETTRKLKDALGLLGIELSDHIIIAGDEHYSMAASMKL